MVVLGGGGLFLMSGVPLYLVVSKAHADLRDPSQKGLDPESQQLVPAEGLD